MKLRNLTTSAILMLIIPTGVLGAQTGGLSLRGSLRSSLGAYHRMDDRKFDFTGSNLLTVNIRNNDRKRAKVELSFDVLQPYGATAEAYFAELEQTASLLDTAVDLLDVSELFDPLLFDLRKLSVSLYTPLTDVSVGRQVINFGKGYVFSPIDVYSSVDITDLSFRRSGSDVLRLETPFGALAGMDVLTALSSRNGTRMSAIKLYANLAGYDVSAVGMYDDESFRTITGLAFKGDLVLGVYGEAVETFNQDADDRTFEGMLGLDYSWNNTWFITAEYYYREHPGRWGNTDLKNLIYGRHNVFANLQYQHNELLSYAVNTIINTLDEKSISTAQMNYNLFQNTDLTAYVRHYAMNLGPVYDELLPDLEYGAQATVKF